MSTILVVDDEPALLKLCQALLESEGYQVFTANSGEKALEVLRDRTAPIDLAVLDQCMPGMQGTELATGIHKLDPNAAIVLMTGSPPKEIARVVGADSPYPIIWKPFQFEHFIGIVERSLAARGGSSRQDNNSDPGSTSQNCGQPV